MSHRLKDCEDLVTLRMTPPTPLDGPADDHLRQARNGALARYEDHALLPDKCQCLFGGHMLVPGAERDGLTDRFGRGIILLSRSAVEEAREECRQRGPPFGQQLRRDIDVAAMNVAPAPGLAAFVGCNQRMTGCVEVLQSVRVLRILAASDMSAGQAYSKLIPLRPEREAFLTAARGRRYLPNLAYMFAMFGHWLSPSPQGVRMNEKLGVSVVIEFSAAPWTVGGMREQARTRYGKAAVRADACEFVAQERDECDRWHSYVQDFSSLGQRIRKANKEERGAGDQDEVPLFLA